MQVFDRLHKAGLAINLPKSEFFASELEFRSQSTPAASGSRQNTQQWFKITLTRARRKKFPGSSVF